MNAPQPRTGLWTPKQVAEFLQVPESRLARWRSNGTGPAYLKYGRIIRYVPGQVITWTNKQIITPED